MKETLSKTLSANRLAELFQLTKLSSLSEAEEALDKSYLEQMIASAAKIDGIDTNHLNPATHTFDVAQRLRQDRAIDTKEDHKAYQKLAPKMVQGLYSVPTVIE